ncbi:O-antigen ligase family protein [Parasphingorhabdus sp.]|uniref:O-antigen ligase family protein n=1 Tax=Parasphingorhabdus sp. TaxID=2709688 RepID=UPI003BB0D7F0
MKFSKRTLKTIQKRLSEPDFRFYAFVAFMVIVFFTGGGSRDDVQSLILLRPVAFLFCAYALTVVAPGQWQGRRFPLYIVGALMALMILQLIPLPPSLWTELPGRQIFADIATIAGIDQPWRPLTMSPSKTLNSLFSMVVPAAAMMLYLNLDREYRRYALPVLLVLCSISALWAVFQLVGPARGPLYLYRITNFGSGVGLFANRNHQVVLLASAIAMFGWYAASLKPSAKFSVLKYYGSIAAIFVLVPLIFITGSRAGLLLMVPGLVFALFFLYFGRFNSEAISSGKSSGRSKIGPFTRRQVILVVGIGATLGLSILSVLLSRSLAYDRLFGGGELVELRLQLLPTLFKMTEDFFLWGIGFGSFEHVYKIYEPLELLRPNYLNQAHNDWLQYPMEGGLPAVLIFLCALGWVSTRLISLARNWRESGFTKYRAVMSFAVILFCLAASIGDYPLRVPSIMAIFALLICVFSDSVDSVQRHDIKQR